MIHADGCRSKAGKEVEVAIAVPGIEQIGTVTVVEIKDILESVDEHVFFELGEHIIRSNGVAGRVIGVHNSSYGK